MLSYQKCRFCKRSHWEVIGPLFKYAVRHYICATCFLDKKWGFDRLTCWQLNQFPAPLAHKFGRYDELGEAIKAYEAAEKGVVI